MPECGGWPRNPSLEYKRFRIYCSTMETQKKQKKTAINVFWLFFILTAIAGSGMAAEPADGSGSSILGIRSYMQNADKYSGTVELEGVVSQILSDQNLVVLIDMEEYKECQVVTCALLRLPVLWEGELPATYDIVRVRGEAAVRDGGRRQFIAKELKKVGQVDAKK